MKVVKLIDHVNPAFYPLCLAKESHLIVKGGRASTKSSVISLLLAEQFLRDPGGNVVCLRKTEKHLRTSVYEQVRWALEVLGAGKEFVLHASPPRITHQPTGTAFYFFGAGDPRRLKSAKLGRGHLSALWFEELDEFQSREEVDIIEDSYLRGNRRVTVFYSFNPPRSPYHWVNEWTEEKRGNPAFFLHHSTYRDDERGYLSDQLLQKIETCRLSDPDYYRWMYLGEAVGLSERVYRMELMQPLTAPDDAGTITALSYACDTGHQVSATACLCFGMTHAGKVILLDTYYYSPAGKPYKKAPSELSADLYSFLQDTAARYRVPVKKRTIDSAEGGLRNQYYKDYAIRWNPVRKRRKADMIDFVQDLLAQNRFYYLDTPENQVFLEEHRQYRWDKRTLQAAAPDVVKERDHTCDALQYFVADHLRELRLI